MKIFKIITLIVLAATVLSAQEKDTKTVFREPFTLKLPVDKESYYEQDYDKLPYVYKNSVYLFKGENFGINIKIEKGEIVSVEYQKDLKKADIEFKFWQEMEKDAPKTPKMMMLSMQNNTKETIYIDALMTTPGSKKIQKTSILPLPPKLGGYEMWPHPIIQLVLMNFRLQEKKEK